MQIHQRVGVFEIPVLRVDELSAKNSGKAQVLRAPAPRKLTKNITSSTPAQHRITAAVV